MKGPNWPAQFWIFAKMPSPEAAIASTKVGDAAAGTGMPGIVGAWWLPIGSPLIWDGLAASSVAEASLQLPVATAPWDISGILLVSSVTFAFGHRAGSCSCCGIWVLLELLELLGYLGGCHRVWREPTALGSVLRLGDFSSDTSWFTFALGCSGDCCGGCAVWRMALGGPGQSPLFGYWAC